MDFVVSSAMQVLRGMFCVSGLHSTCPLRAVGMAPYVLGDASSISIAAADDDSRCRHFDPIGRFRHAAIPAVRRNRPSGFRRITLAGLS